MLYRKLTALEGAAEQGNITKVQELQTANKDFLLQIGRINKYLAKNEISPESKQLDDKACQLLRTMMDEQTRALTLAASNGHLEVVKEILKYNAIEKRHPMHCSMDSVNLRKEEEPSIHTALMWSIQQNQAAVVRELLAHGAAADHKSTVDKGKSMLMLAAESGYIDLVIELLKYKTVRDEMDEQDATGKTALIWAAMGNWSVPEEGINSLAVVQELLKHHAATDKKDVCFDSKQRCMIEGETAYEKAVKLGHIKIAEALAPAKPEVSKAFFETLKSIFARNNPQPEEVQKTAKRSGFH